MSKTEKTQTGEKSAAQTGKIIKSAGQTDAAVAGTISGALLAIVANLQGTETGFRSVIDGVLGTVRRCKDMAPELVQARVASLFTQARDAIVAGLSIEARADWDAFVPKANPARKEDRKGKGLPAKDRLNARDVRVIARRAGKMTADVRQSHDAFEASYNFASKASRIVDALLGVPAFGDSVKLYQSRKPNGIDYKMTASGLYDVARELTREEKPETAPAGDAGDGAQDGGQDGKAGDTREAIIARTVAQLHAIGDDAMADAILALVAQIAAPVVAVADAA